MDLHILNLSSSANTTQLELIKEIEIVLIIEEYVSTILNDINIVPLSGTRFSVSSFHSG